MIRSESIVALAGALSKAQSEFNAVPKNTRGYNYNYADLGAVWQMVRDPLTRNELSITQIPELIDTMIVEENTGSMHVRMDVAVETVLMHSSGEWISGIVKLPVAKQDAQGVGSAITYARRYGLSAILGVVSDEDDDGKTAIQGDGEKKQAGSTTKKNAPAPATKPAATAKTADDLFGKGAASKRKDEITTVCGALKDAGDSSVSTAGKLNQFCQDNFDKPLASLDNDEVTILITDLTTTLEERKAMAEESSGETATTPAAETETATEGDVPSHTGIPDGTIKEGQLNALQSLCDIKDLDETDLVLTATNNERNKFSQLNEDEAAKLIKEINKK